MNTERKWPGWPKPDTRPQLIIDAAEKEQGDFFLGVPERWLNNPTWRCPRGHISKNFLKSEERGDLCLACFEPVRLTFPEDTELKP